MCPPRRGRVVFDGRTSLTQPPYARARRGLGYVPQGREIFPGLSVRDNLRMGFAGRSAEERIDSILGTFPRLAPLLDRRGAALSGGEQQLLAIARCLAGNPKLILFDEPTEGIQPSIIEELVVVLQRLHQTQGLTIVLVEQNLEFIAELSTRVLLIQKGAILRELNPGSSGRRTSSTSSSASTGPDRRESADDDGIGKPLEVGVAGHEGCSKAPGGCIDERVGHGEAVGAIDPDS